MRKRGAKVRKNPTENYCSRQASAGSQAGNSTQKTLPFPGSDSTPTRPPILSAPLRTRATPIPVPAYLRV